MFLYRKQSLQDNRVETSHWQDLEIKGSCVLKSGIRDKNIGKVLGFTMG